MLEIENLDVFYGLLQALFKISIKIRENEIYAVIGANGAGKTTLLNSVMGLCKPTSGTIKYSNQDITKLPPYIRFKRGIAIVPEGRELFPDLTLSENLQIGAHKITDKTEIKKNYETVFGLFPSLKGRENRLAKTFSGGEQQMIAIGRALMSGPKLLLLDEPSAGLMPILVAQMFESIQKLRGVTTILLVEQNAMKALSIADRAVLLSVGRTVLEDEAKSMMNDPLVKKAYIGA